MEWLKLPGKTQWSRAVVTSKIAPRSYKVEANGRAYRRNQKQLRSTKEPLQESTLEMDLITNKSKLRFSLCVFLVNTVL